MTVGLARHKSILIIRLCSSWIIKFRSNTDQGYLSGYQKLEQLESIKILLIASFNSNISSLFLAIVAIIMNQGCNICELRVGFSSHKLSMVFFRKYFQKYPQNPPKIIASLTENYFPKKSRGGRPVYQLQGDIRPIRTSDYEWIET